MPKMIQPEFERRLEAWIEDLRAGAVNAFEVGCAPEKCVHIGVMIADARELERDCDRDDLIARTERLIAKPVM